LRLKKQAWRIITIVFISLIVSATICNYKGDQWEENVRTVLYKIKNDSIPDYAKENIDDKGIPFVYYREQNGITAGNQYNATIVCNYALDYYKSIQQTNDSSLKRKFLNCINWLEQNMTYKNGYALYEFKWQQPWYPSVGAPYTSGMTSGRAIEVFTYAYRLSHSPKYLSSAKALLRAFYVPIDSGSFTYKEPFGWWYEEIADTSKQTPRILDGHLFSILGVEELWQETKNDSAKVVIDRGLQSLNHYLPQYDAGQGMIYYDANKKIADKKYRRIITSQMKQLYDITNDPIYLEYYNKWMAPLQKPYILRVTKEKNISGMILYSLMFVIVAVSLFIVNNLIAKKIGKRQG
jgi:heparosan-N-sulfate-glucuronate 5-epimerase